MRCTTVHSRSSFFIIGGKFRGQLDKSADALGEYVSIIGNLCYLHIEVRCSVYLPIAILTHTQVHPLRINVPLWDFGHEGAAHFDLHGVPFPDAVVGPLAAAPVVAEPAREIIGVWERRDEFLGVVRNGRRLGVGPEPDNRHVDTRNTVDDFKVCCLTTPRAHPLPSGAQIGELVLVWHWGIWWHATIGYIARTRGTVTIKWPDKSHAAGYLPRLIRKLPGGAGE